MHVYMCACVYVCMCVHVCVQCAVCMCMYVCNVHVDVCLYQNVFLFINNILNTYFTFKTPLEANYHMYSHTIMLVCARFYANPNIFR